MSITKNKRCIVIIASVLIVVLTLFTVSHSYAADDSYSKHLSLVVSPAGVVGHIADATNEAAYGFIRNTDGTAEIVAYNITGEKAELLSATTSDRFGAIADANGGVAPICTDDYVFIYKAGVVDITGATESSITRAKYDGSDRQTIILPSDESMDLTSGIVSDQNDLYFIKYSYDTETGFIKEVYLAKSNFSKGCIDNLCSLGSIYDSRYFIYGVANDDIVFVRLLVDTSDYNYLHDGCFNSQNSKYIVELYDPNSGFCSTEIEWRYGERSPVIYNDHLYYTTRDNQIYCVDLSSFQVEYIDVSTSYDYSELFFTGEVFDDHLMLVAIDEDGETFHNGGLNVQTREIDFVNLSYTDSDGIDFCTTILAENDNYFFVLCGAEYQKVEDVLEDGSPYSFERRFEQKGFISKSDYWSSKDNYIIVDDSALY